MAAITNYSELKAAAQQWLNRKDQSAINAIPLCISFAEQDFQRTFRLPHNETVSEYVVTSQDTDANGDLLPISIDLGKTYQNYYEAKHLTVNGITYNRVSVDVFNKIKDGNAIDSTTNGLTVTDYGDSTGKEFYFTRIGDQLRTIPELQIGDKIQFIYYTKIQEMVGESDSPESLKAAPDVMLYLTLRHASLFLRDNEQAQFWEQKAEQAGSRLMVRLEEIEWSGSPLVVNEFKY